MAPPGRKPDSTAACRSSIDTTVPSAKQPQDRRWSHQKGESDNTGAAQIPLWHMRGFTGPQVGKENRFVIVVESGSGDNLFEMDEHPSCRLLCEARERGEQQDEGLISKG